jgi:hypothetical protein
VFEVKDGPLTNESYAVDLEGREMIRLPCPDGRIAQYLASVTGASDDPHYDDEIGDYVYWDPRAGSGLSGTRHDQPSSLRCTTGPLQGSCMRRT